MDPLTTAAAAGLQARMDSIDLLANNLANTSASGYKSDREFYSTYLSSEAQNADAPAVGDAPVVERHWTDFAQGSLTNTGNQMDLALSGKGFFSVNGPNGTLYTRNGALQVSASGTLVTGEGYPVRLIGGQPVTLDPNTPVVVGADGAVAQNGAALGQMEIVDFRDANLLEKTGGSYFRSPDLRKVRPAAAPNAQVSQGKLESSNAQPAESAARMVMLLRHFEMLQKAVKIGAEMNQQAFQEVAKVGS